MIFDAAMNLTDMARKELREVLVHDFGENARSLSEAEVDELGFRLLKLTAIALKRNTKTTERNLNVFTKS